MKKPFLYKFSSAKLYKNIEDLTIREQNSLFFRIFAASLYKNSQRVHLIIAIDMETLLEVYNKLDYEI